MRTAVSDLDRFYASPMGLLAAEAVRSKLVQAWGTAERCRVVGFGYPQPFMDGFSGCERIAALVPEGTGVMAGGAIPACLVHDHYWPLPDASVDRLIIVHGLEEVSKPRQLLREAWRVLTDDGLMIIIVPNRRGFWSLFETSPFAAGRPWTRRQLDILLTESMFQPTAHASALHFPPFRSRSLLRMARVWERMGDSMDNWRLSMFLPNLAGLNMVEARKSTAIPITGSKVEAFRPGILVPGGLRPVPPAQGRDRTNRAPSARQFGQNAASGSKRRGWMSRPKA